MPMRGSSLGLGIPGATQTGNTEVNGHNVPTDMDLTGSRTSSQPLEYVAANSINFTGEFESLPNDTYSAYIADESLQPT